MADGDYERTAKRAEELKRMERKIAEWKKQNATAGRDSSAS